MSVGSEHIDKTRPVRPGEELDTTRLEKYLKDHLPEFSGGLEVEQFPGGHSNLTYLLRVGEQEFVLRRPPFGKKIKSAHDMGREYKILSHLSPVYSPAPRPFAFCEDEDVLGAPFYIMERIKGVILRATPPEGLGLSPEVMGKISKASVDNLASIHAVDYKGIGLVDFGKPEGYIERQIIGWTKRYNNAKTDDIPQINEVMDWLVKNMPPESGASLIHNDYKYDNLVLDPDDLSNIIGVLDWEMTTVGDPLMDLGTTLGYWVDPDDPQQLQTITFGLTALPGNLSRLQLAEYYAELRGCDLSDLLFYYVYALFKISVIVQQIYARYKAGYSKDERFAMMIVIVNVLGKAAARALELGRIDRLGN